MAKTTVTDTFVVEVTTIYKKDCSPNDIQLMSEGDYETLFTHLDEISNGMVDSFDTAKVTKLKHFVSETN